jgi:hypothetical protein
VLPHNLKMGWGLVADLVRHLKARDFVNDSNEVGILTNSATLNLNCAEALGKLV